MNTGQTMLTILALLLFGTTVLSVNRNSLNNGTILRQTELGIYAISLATSYIQKATEMDFDENTVGGVVFITTPMPNQGSIPTGVKGASTTFITTPIANLGVDAGESKYFDETFDDFDDYNGFKKDTLVAGVDSFHVASSVYYINDSKQATPFAPATTTSWLKQMDICVNNRISRNVFTGETSGTDTIKLSYILSFYR